MASEWVHLAMQAVDDTNVSLNAALERTCSEETLCQLLEMVDRAGRPVTRRSGDPEPGRRGRRPVRLPEQLPTRKVLREWVGQAMAPPDLRRGNYRDVDHGRGPGGSNP